MSWIDFVTADPRGSASSLQPLQGNPPLMREVSFPRRGIYSSSATPQIDDWSFHGMSGQLTDELELPSMPKTKDLAKEVSSSDFANSSYSSYDISGSDLDTSIHSNDKERRETESCDLEKDSGPYPAPAMKEATQINQRHYCRAEGCSHTKGFARVNDLKRHQKNHNSDTPLWYCGCCKNMSNDGYKGTPRKDHLKQHLMIKHQMETPHHCPEIPCSGRGRILFSSGACVEEHLREEHGYNIINQTTSSGCNCSKKRKESGVSIARKTNEDVSCLSATDRSGPSSPARSQAIKRLIQTDTEPLAKRRRQDSTYSSCDVSENVSPESTFTAVQDMSWNLMSYSPAALIIESMRPDSLGVPIGTNWKFPTDEHSHSPDYRLFLPEFPEYSHLDYCHPWDNIMNIPNDPDPNADSVLGPREIDRSMPLGLEQVPNVHAVDFLALYRTKSSYKLQNFLTAADELLQTAESTSISYNPRTRTINLRCPVTLIKSAKEKLQAVILEISRESGLQYLQTKQIELRKIREKTNVNPLHGTWNTLANQTCDGDLSAKIFALRVKQDSVTITTWNECLLPKLPSILDSAIGQDYAASLVRQGASEVEARPHIRIQSRRKLRLATRKNIKLAIDETCHLNMRGRIPVSFCTGYLRLLVNATSLQSTIEENSLSEDSDEEEDDPGFHTKRYWQYPGMGASIGMRCTRLVSATLGGYVLVDGLKLLLTVDHFIERSRTFTNSPQGRDLLTLTSPSLSDVDEMRERLDLTMLNLQAQSDQQSKKARDTEIFFNDALPPDLEEIAREMDGIQEYQSEINRPDRDFVLGDLVCRCEPNAMLSIDAQSPSSSELATSCRMDWALFSIESRRMGENRHCSESEMAEAPNETSPNGTSDGVFCNDTCDLEPNASVHYVGQRSGPRKGRINAVQMLLRSGGISTNEWALICPEQISRSDGCEGDSGAWVLREGDNKLVGLLWGWIDGQLLLSPINKVFADIKNTFRARDVSLPRDRINREPPVMDISRNAVPEPVLICAVKKRKPAKPYNVSTILRSNPKSLQPISRAKASSGNEAVTSQGTSFAFETQDITAPSRGRKSLPSHSSNQATSDSSLELDITSPVEYSSPSCIVDTSSIGKLSVEKQPQPMCQIVPGIVNNHDSQLSTTDPKVDIMIPQRSHLARAVSAGPECVSHTKYQNFLRYIYLPVSSNILAFGLTSPSESQSMKLKYKSSTFPCSQRDIAARPKGHDFKSFNSHLRFGKLKGGRMRAATRRMVGIVA